MERKTFYCVIQNYPHKGMPKACLHFVDGQEKPKDAVFYSKKIDRYFDYFDTEEEALAFYNDVFTTKQKAGGAV